LIVPVVLLIQGHLNPRLYVPRIKTQISSIEERIIKGRRKIVSEYPVVVKYSLTDLWKVFEPVILAAASFFNEEYA